MGYVFGQKIDADLAKVGGHYFQIGRVKSIVMGPYIANTKMPNPDYKGASDIGKISYEILYSTKSTSKSKEVSPPAWPIFSFIKQYPTVNEIVLIIAGPTDKLNDNFSSQKFFYFPPYDLWNHVNHAAFPNLDELAQFRDQYINQPRYQGSAVIKPPLLPLGYTFQEKEDIRNLQPFEGDTILESRFGQSIRFGSTVPVMKNSNNWSNYGDNGDPITMIINGQGKTSNLSKFDLKVEDINKDKSSIYLTAGQEINMEDLNLFPLNSFKVNIGNIIQPPVQLVKPVISDEVTSAQFQDENSIK